MNSSPVDKVGGIGTFWHGSDLGVLERACLRSMIEQGHEVTIFSGADVSNVPDGVRLCDAREIIGDQLDMFFRQVGKDQHLTLFSDIFRYRMIQETNLVWADLDIFLLRPLHPTNGYLFAREDDRTINGAVLALPKDAPALSSLIKFSGNPFPVPPFYSARKRLNLFMRKLIGCPKHISQMPWGILGPTAITYFFSKHGIDNLALPARELYPIHYSQNPVFLMRYDYVVEKYLSGGEGTAVYIWGADMRKIVQKFDEIPTESFLHRLLSNRR